MKCSSRSWLHNLHTMICTGDVISEDESMTLIAGLAMGHNVFQDLEGLAMPTAGGFVGYIDYIAGN